MLNTEELAIAAARAHEQKPRRDYVFHQTMCRITESQLFNGSIIFIIFINALFIALETAEELKKEHDYLFTVVDFIFLGVYTIEFAMKLYAEPINYWKSYYNLFDFGVLTISFVQAGIMSASGEESDLNGLRVLRALRTLRTLRTVSFIRGLQVLVTALLDTIKKWVINILMLLLLIMFLFAIMGYYFFGYREDSNDKKHWGSLGSAMLSLFSYVTVEGWTDLQEDLDVISASSRVYTILFIFLGHFIFTNVFIGVIIINISEATETYKKELRKEREAVVRHKKEFMMMRQHNDVKQMLERQKKGAFSNFAEMTRSFEKGLRHYDSNLVSDLCTNILWMETFMNSMDHYDNIMFRSQQLHFEIANVLVASYEDRLEAKKKKKGLRRNQTANNPF